MDGYKTPTLWVLLASGLFAGFLAYTMSRRAAHRERIAPTTAVMERMKEFGDTEAARAGREFVSERVLPEMKPVLLDLLKDAESYVDHTFKRAEKAIKSL